MTAIAPVYYKCVPRDARGLDHVFPGNLRVSRGRCTGVREHRQNSENGETQLYPCTKLSSPAPRLCNIARVLVKHDCEVTIRKDTLALVNLGHLVADAPLISQSCVLTLHPLRGVGSSQG